MVNCENPDSISSSWDDVNDFSTTNNKPIGKITISAELEQKLNNLIGSKAGSLNPTPVPLPHVPPPMPPLSLNTITNQQITRRKSLDSDLDNLTSVSASSRRRKTLFVKKNRRLSLGNEPRPLPRPSHICIETDLKSNEVKSPKYDLKMSVDRRQLHYLSVGFSFITGYLFCFYFGKSC